MARDFDGSADKIVFTPSTYPITSYPFTMFAWSTSDDTTTGVNINLADVSVDNVYYHIAKLASTPVIQVGARNTSQENAIGTTAIGSGWRNYMGYFTSATDREAFLDGVSEGTNTVSVTLSGNLDIISIGNLERLNPIVPWNGDIAHCAMWTAELSANSRSALNNGVNPFVIEHDTLAFYAPVDGNESPEPDYVNQDTGTVTSAPPKSPGPPVEPLENHL